MAKHSQLDGLIKWSQREEWYDLLGDVIDAHFGEICEEHGVDFDKLPELIGDSFGALWACAFEDFLTQPRSEDSEETIVDDYLKRRGWKESVTNKRYMEALRDSLMSLYEVSEIVPGQSMLLRDLILGGEPVRVIEHTATQGLKPRDRIGARVVLVSGQYRLSGGLVVYRPEAATSLLDDMKEDMKAFRREFKKGAKAAGLAEIGLAGAETADLTYLIGAAPMFTFVWLDFALSRLLDKVRPTILNMDGDELNFYSARFPFAPGITAETLRARLDVMPALVAAGNDFWSWEDGAKVLGSIELQAGELLFEANSSRRTALGSDMLKGEFGVLLGKPAITVRSLEELGEQFGDAPQNPADSPFAPEEAAAVLGDMLDAYYRATLDEPVPMLGGVTPRDAAKTKAGQRKLVDWLKYLENQSADFSKRGPAAPYDFRWIWDELRIAHLRK